MSGFKHLERIDAYMEGSMSEGERQRFEADLLSDAELRTEYDACLAAEEATELMAFRGMVERIKQEDSTEKPTPNNRLKWGTLALILLAAILAWWFLARPKENPALPTNPTPQDSLRQVPVPLDPVQDSDAAPLIAPAKDTKLDVQKANQRQIALAKSLYEPIRFSDMRGNNALYLDSASVAFDSGKYRLAIKLASAVKKGGNGYAQARGVTAHASFQLGDYQMAAPIFEELAAQAGDAGKAEEGYLLLSWLAAGKSQTARFKSLLDKIKGDKWHPFHKKALMIN